MRASEWGKPPNALRAKGAEKEEEERCMLEDHQKMDCPKKSRMGQYRMLNLDNIV
jgi:hypothetical protein